MSSKVNEKKKMRFIKEEEKRDLIVYEQHLRHLYKIEKRENRFPTYKIKFKSEQQVSPVVKVREEIKQNKLLLNQKPIKIKSESKEFIDQVNLIRKIEMKRLKKSNEQLKAMMHNLKSISQRASTKLNLSSIHNSNRATDHSRSKSKLHSLPYMRFANAYNG